MDRQIEERAASYSFNTDSALFNALPMELQSMWKQDIENAYRAGAKDELENPTGGQLLYVCSKSSARGRKECLQTLWFDPEISVNKCAGVDSVEFKRCRTCAHRLRFALNEYSPKVIQCCELQPSKRSNSGYKTIKVTDIACVNYKDEK